MRRLGHSIDGGDALEAISGRMWLNLARICELGLVVWEYRFEIVFGRVKLWRSLFRKIPRIAFLSEVVSVSMKYGMAGVLGSSIPLKHNNKNNNTSISPRWPSPYRLVW